MMIRKSGILISLLLLSGCTSSSRFSCPDAKGARCVMLSQVDKQVSSGEIEEIHQKKKGCLFGKCSKDKDSRPPLAQTEVIKAKISTFEDQGSYQEGDYLYVK